MYTSNNNKQRRQRQKFKEPIRGQYSFPCRHTTFKDVEFVFTLKVNTVRFVVTSNKLKIKPI